jgi:hypothetical protein
VDWHDEVLDARDMVYVCRSQNHTSTIEGPLAQEESLCQVKMPMSQVKMPMIDLDISRALAPMQQSLLYQWITVDSCNDAYNGHAQYDDATVKTA